MRDRNLAEVEVTTEAAETFRRAVNDALPNTLWASGCRSWYLGADGKPVLWPWTMGRFECELGRLASADFHERHRMTASEPQWTRP